MKPLQNANEKSGQRNASSVGGITLAPFLARQALKGLELIFSPVWLWDPGSCRILWGNRAAIEYWAAGSLGSLQEISADMAPSKADVLAAYAQTVEEGASTSGLWAARQNGQPVAVTCRFTAIKSDTGCTAFLVEPETGPAALSSSSRSSDTCPTPLPDNPQRISNAQAKVFEVMTKGTDLESALGSIATVIELSLGAGRCSIQLPDPGTTRLSQCVAPSLPAELNAALKGLETGGETTPSAAAFLRREPVVVTDIAAEPTWKHFANLAVQNSVHACLSVPVFSQEHEILGIITVFYDKPQDAIAEDQRVLEAVASPTALAIQHWRSEGSWRLACDRLASLARTIPGVVYQRMVTPEGDIRYTYISEGTRDLFGVSPEEILADPDALFNCHGPEYRATFRERLLKASKNLELWDVEAQIITRDGEEKWTHAIARPQKQPDGSVLWDGVILDATRIKKAEFQLREAKEAADEANLVQTELIEQLRSADERFASLARTIPGVVYQRVVRPDGDIRYSYISDGARDLFGVSPEEILADPNALFNCHGPEYRATFRERLLEASKNLELWDVEAQIITRDGEEKWTHAIARPQKQPDGSVLWDGVILDATRIKKAELATEAAAAHTRKTIVESLSQGFILFGSDDRLVVCNRRYLDLFPDLKGVATPGASYEDVARAEIQFHSNEDDDVKLEKPLSERLEKHHLPEYTVERQWPNGRWVLIREYRTFDGSTVIFFTDVTDIKVREEKLRRVNRQLDIALRNMSQGLCVFDAERRMVLANKKYGEIFQLSDEFIRVGVNFTDHMDYVFSQFNYNEPAARTLVQERLKHIDSGTRCTFFLSFPDGRTVEAIHQPLLDGGSVETFSEW